MVYLPEYFWINVAAFTNDPNTFTKINSEAHAAFHKSDNPLRAHYLIRQDNPGELRNLKFQVRAAHYGAAIANQSWSALAWLLRAEWDRQPETTIEDRIRGVSPTCLNKCLWSFMLITALENYKPRSPVIDAIRALCTRGRVLLRYCLDRAIYDKAVLTRDSEVISMVRGMTERKRAHAEA